MKLDNRLNHIIEMCKYSDIIIDIGCDHGYISIGLIQKNKCRKCYAIDINDGPLKNAQLNINLCGLDNKIKCIKSNGFDFLNENVDIDINNISSVIAGMGGVTIANILEQNSKKVNNMDYILIQPNSYPRDIRKFLNNNKIHIETEDIIFSKGVYYEYILIFPKRQGVLSEEVQKFLLEFEYEIPTCIMDNTDGRYNSFILHKIRKYTLILSELGKMRVKNYKKWNTFNNRVLKLKGYLT